jgi:hypothetical protein
MLVGCSSDSRRSCVGMIQIPEPIIYMIIYQDNCFNFWRCYNIFIKYTGRTGGPTSKGD